MIHAIAKYRKPSDSKVHQISKPKYFSSRLVVVFAQSNEAPVGAAPTIECSTTLLSAKMRFILTHWGRVMHICVNKLAIISSDDGLSPGRRQAIIWTNAGILLIGPSRTNFSEILIKI